MISIHDCLSKQTTQMLCELGFRLMAEPPEKRSKADWIRQLEHTIRTADPDDLRRLLTLNELHALRDFARPCASDPSVFTVDPRAAQHFDTLDNALHALKEMGMAWRTREGWMLCREAIDLTDISARQEKELRFRDDIVARVVEPLALCGAMPLGEAFRAARLPNDQDLVNDFLHTWSARYGFAGVHIVNKEETWLAHPWCEEPEQIIVSQHAKESAKLSYAEQEGLPLMTSDGDYVAGRARDYAGMLALLQKNGLSRDDAILAMRDIILELQNGNEEQSAELLAATIVTSPAPAQIRTISAFYEHVPLWRLKGHTIVELTGRSDPAPTAAPTFKSPCPCGSGRPYGRCCGRKN